MTDTNITCPKCGAEIPLTEAVSHRLRDQLSAQFEKERADLNAAVGKREQQLETEKTALEARAKSIEAMVGERLECGSILWEAKRARKWSADWPEKLKNDQRTAGAELAVVVTTCPPEGVRGIAPLDGVWICEPTYAVALAAALRQGLVRTAAQRAQKSNRADKVEALYDYLCGLEFRQHVEAIVESFVGLKEQLDSEQRVFARQWKEREKQLQKALRHTAEMYGGVQGIAGREALPEISTLALPE